MPRYKKAERERIVAEARRRLLDAALDEFADRGYARANINRISRAAGFAQGTVYNYFPSKRALFEAVIADIATRQAELVLQGAASAPSPPARLERFLAAGYAFAQGFPAASQVIAAALYGADPDARDLARRAYEPLAAYVEREILLPGLSQGLFRPLDAQLASAAILALYLGGCAAHDGAAPLRLNPRAAAALLLEGLRKT
jgi:AcrR family transcriptional regulator